MSIEYFIRLKALYDEGLLASEYDNKAAKMVNSAALDALIKDITPMLPEVKKPLEAAKAMREIPDRDEAIEAAGDKVVDLRAQFARKMSTNQGAYGLVKDYVLATWDVDAEKQESILEDMIDLVTYTEGWDK